MSYRLSKKSRSTLANVHPDLVRVVNRAIELTAQDFTVFEGVRTLERQRILVAQGASTTLDSKHRIQPDGYGHAVDLVPWVNGAPLWSWPHAYAVAVAVRDAANELGVTIRWGGVWDRRLNELSDMKSAVQGYVERRKIMYPKKKVFIDAPHFEIVI